MIWLGWVLAQQSGADAFVRLAFVLLLLATRGSTLQAYNTAGGALVLAVGAGASLLAYRMMLTIGRLPEEQRVLR